MATESSCGKTAEEDDNMERQLSTLSLSEVEKHGVVLASSERTNLLEVKWLPAARLLTSKNFSEQTLISTMWAAWKQLERFISALLERTCS
jgi:hypothetical protein